MGGMSFAGPCRDSLRRPGAGGTKPTFRGLRMGAKPAEPVWIDEVRLPACRLGSPQADVSDPCMPM